MGIVTTFVGLPKGRELWAWLLLYTFMLLAVFFVEIHSPFWTVVVGSLFSGLAVASVQSAFMGKYARHNPWYRGEMDGHPAKVALSLYLFAIFASAIFGVLAGSIAWALAAI